MDQNLRNQFFKSEWGEYCQLVNKLIGGCPKKFYYYYFNINESDIFRNTLRSLEKCRVLDYDFIQDRINSYNQGLLGKVFTS